MSRATIIFADNNAEFLNIRKKMLEDEGYDVIPAYTYDQARQVLEQRSADLAVLDLRLRDEDDEKDTSGLTLARETARSLPKMILTNYPSISTAREALKPQMDGLPAAVEFIGKKEGDEAFIWAVRRALGPDRVWLRSVKKAVDGTDQEIKRDHSDARRQSNTNFIFALIAACLGIGIIYYGIILALANKVDVGIGSTIGGIVTEAVGVLFFVRVDMANKRMDRYHDERVQGQRFQTLLQACEGLETSEGRKSCHERIILTATGNWLKPSPRDQKPAGISSQEQQP